MLENKYQVKLNYSEVTLMLLTDPLYHIQRGCQFNYSEFQQKISLEKHSGQNNNQEQCPVCHQYGSFARDIPCTYNSGDQREVQIIHDPTRKELFQLPKSPYDLSNLSSEKEVFNLQMAFNQNEIITNSNQRIDMSWIEQLNQERSQDFFILIRNLPDQGYSRIPILMGIIKHKLILFYHTYKMKLELDLYDETNPKDQFKMNQNNSGNITQIVYFRKHIYLIVEQQTISQLYRGDLFQIYQPKSNEPKFNVHQLPGYTMNNQTKLISKQDESCFMFGTKGCIEITDQIDPKIAINENLPIHDLRFNCQINHIGNDTIIIANQQNKQITEIKYRNYGLLEQSSEHQLSNSCYFDGSIVFKDKVILINSAQLTLTTFTAQHIIPGSMRPFICSIKILNHQSYMKVILIPSISAQFETLTCHLVGLKLPNYENSSFSQEDVILPGLLVYNNVTSSIEIELM